MENLFLKIGADLGPLPKDQGNGSGTTTIDNAFLDATSKLKGVGELKAGNLQAFKELGENVKIGVLGGLASVLENIKRKGIELMTSAGPSGNAGALDQFDVDKQMTLYEDPRTGILTDPEANKRWRLDQNNPFSISNMPGRHQLQQPSGAQVMKLLTLLPDIGAKSLRAKQAEMQAEQPELTYLKNPIAMTSRRVLQDALPSLGTAVLVGLATKDPVAGIAFLGETTGGATFEQEIQKGRSPQRATIVAGLNEIFEIGGEMLVFPKILKGITKGVKLKDAVHTVLENAGQEGVTGFSQQFVTSFSDEMIKTGSLFDSLKTAFAEGAAAIPENVLLAVVTAGFGGAAAIPMSVVQNRAIEQARIERDTEVLSAATTVFNASGILQENQTMTPVKKLSKKQQQIMELGDATGKSVIFYDSPDTVVGDLNGLSFPEAPNTIFINKSTDDPVMQVFSHELTHTLKQTSPELYQQLGDIVGQFTETEKITSALEEIGVPADQMTDEIIAEVIGRVGTRLDFANLLAQKQPTLLETIVQHIKKFVSSFFQNGQAPAWADAYITDLKGLQSNLEAALVNRQQEAGVQGQTGEVLASRMHQSVIDQYAKMLTDVSPNKTNRPKSSIVRTISEVFEGTTRPATDILRADNGFVAPDGKAIMFNRPEMHENIAKDRGSTLRDIVAQGGMRYAKFGESATFELGGNQISQEQVSFIYRVLKQNPEVDTMLIGFGMNGESIAQNINGTVDINRAIEKIRDRVEVYASRKKSIKRRIGEATGLKPVEKVIETTERRMLKGKFSEQVKGAKAGYQQRAAEAKTELAILSAKKKMTQKMRDAASSMVLRYLPKDEQGKWLKRIGRIDTTKKFQVVINTLKAAVEKSEQRHAVNELKRTIKDIKAKYGSRVIGRTMLKKYGDTLRTLLDSFQVSGQTMETTVRTDDLIAMASQVLATSDSLPITTQAQKIYDELESQRNKTIGVNKLSAEAVQALTDEIKWLDHQNEWEERTIADENAKKFDQINADIIDELPPVEEYTDSIKDKAKKFIFIKHSNIETLGDNMAGGQGGEYSEWAEGRKAITENVFDKIDKGVDKQYISADKMFELVQSILTANNVNEDTNRKWEETTHSVVLGGKTFELTEQHIMSLYMHSRAAHNLTVLLSSGISLDKVKSKGMTIEELDSVLSLLDSQQIAVCEQLGKQLFDGIAKGYMNEASNLMDGFDLARENNYWPAKRFLDQKIPSRAVPFTMQSAIEGMAIAQQRVGIGNPMKMLPFIQTVHDAVQNVSAYYGMAPAFRDVKQVLNDSRLIEHMNENGYQEHLTGMRNMVRKIEDNSAELDYPNKVLAQLTGKFAKSVFSLNAKLWVRQYISIQLVAAYVAPRHMAAIRGLQTEDIINQIREDSPQLIARIRGHRYDRDIGTAVMGSAMQLHMFNSEPPSNMLLAGMSYFDTNTVTDIWRIATSEVKEANPSLDESGAEFRKIRKDRAEFLLRKTQSNWHVKDRTLIGSSPNPLTKSLTMFSSQREKIVMMMTSAYVRFRADGNTAKFAKILGNVVASSALISMFNIAFASLILKRPWPEKEKLLTDTLQDMIGLPYGGVYVAQTLAYLANRITGNPVYGKVVDIPPLRVIEIGISSAGDLTMAAKAFIEGDRNWKKKAFKAVDNAAEAVALYKGYPYIGPKEIYRGLQRWNVVPEIWPEAGQQRSVSTQKGRSRRKRRTR